jgi:hypothetical protein
LSTSTVDFDITTILVNHTGTRELHQGESRPEPGPEDFRILSKGFFLDNISPPSTVGLASARKIRDKEELTS